ncbi:MAG: hypothetical protein BECKG1743D_GA0114223_107011 [Candidatus Kentron sp. G]|nr:MAG: hypothetical protein BECKG1743F_GA0114225_103443 [Candidatus Kentron sp. G]VFN00789.1 MAG: hypothetical protein BECKG1743E_GA0114224_103513 [Candidatus Kentron sp. G]VFN05311.1 MAG: hypothetical protein BECKG1743D_GA0114223_107011 [Candidatus Kentron sp. G]
MGKTALTAEAIHLWHGRFEYVLAVQTKPVAMGCENYLQRLDIRLALASPVYRQRCLDNPLDRLYLEPEMGPGTLDPDERRARMRANLLDVLRAEHILLVLDNFETQLNVGVAGVERPKRKPPVGRAKPGASPRHAYPCRDPDWDKLLTELVLGLPGTGSRLLLTSRHRPAALVLHTARERPGPPTNPGALWLPLGPLPAREAVLFLRSHPHLQTLIEAGEFDLLERLLTVSRGHPLILDRLARLAADRDNLAQALERLERDKLVKGLPALPDFFGNLSGDGAAAAREKEQRYLEETAVGAVHLLIEGLTPAARQLLWVMTLANEPVSEALLRDVWDGRSAMEKQIDLLRESRQDIEAIPAKRVQLERLLTQMPPAGQPNDDFPDW